MHYSETKAKHGEFIKVLPPQYTNKTLDDLVVDRTLMNQMQKIVLNIYGHNIFSQRGTNPDKSFLIYGPQGTGKTHAIECLTGELIKNNGYGLWIKEYSIGSHGSSHIDGGSLSVQKFFDEGLENIRPDLNMNCVLYIFDESEMILGKRGKYSGQEDDKRTNTFMMNMQRINNLDTPEFLFFLTNKPQVLDEASIRSGKIDQQIAFPLPDFKTRIRLFQYSIEQINDKAAYKVIRKYDLKELAELSEGFNCADCIEIPNRAVKKTIFEDLAQKIDPLKKKRYIFQKRLVEQAHEQRKSSNKTLIGKLAFLEKIKKDIKKNGG